MAAEATLLTRPFLVTCLTAFLFYLSVYLLLPVMPLYVAAMGGIMTGATGAGLLLQVADFPLMHPDTCHARTSVVMVM